MDTGECRVSDSWGCGMGTSLNQYEVVRELGRGGMGRVLLARDTDLDRLVAIKVITNAGFESSEQFLLEARALARCRHENVVTIHHVGKHEDQPFMVLEYLEGGSLRGWLSTDAAPGARRERAAIELMVPVARALAYLHLEGIVHRDLKPENVVLSASGVVKVVDFGVAKLLLRTASGGQPSGQRIDPWAAGGGSMAGTLPYMAPEQLTMGHVDHRSDIWAAGIVLHELALGRHPLGKSFATRLWDVAAMDRPMPETRGCSPALARLIDRCLEKRPEDRVQSSSDLVAELEALARAHSHVAEATPTAGRRQIVLLRLELVDAASWTARLDPEDLQELVESFHALCTTVVDRFGGRIEHLSAEGVSAYFGWPHAHEDDALRCIRASLGIRDGAQEVGARLEGSLGARPSVRLGVHTGPTVLVPGTGGAKQNPLAMSAAPAACAAISAGAAPSSVTISEQVLDLIRGWVEVEDAGEIDVAAAKAPIRVYRLLRERPSPGRFWAKHTGVLPSIIGRTDERRDLLAQWERAVAGERVTVVVEGEAGIGKSRLVHWLLETIDAPPRRVFIAQCEPLTTHTPFAAVSAALRARWSGDGCHLDAEVGAADPTTKLLLAMLAQVAPPPEAEPAAVSRWTPQRLRAATRVAVRTWLQRLASSGPLVCVFEDVHWADASTMELLAELTAEVPAQVLFLVTSRTALPDLRTPRAVLNLRPLSMAESESLATETAGSGLLTAEVAHRIAGHADGVPLFVEELTRAVLAFGAAHDPRPDGEAALSGVPASLQGTFAAQLDALGESRQLVQTAALIGRDVDRDLLGVLCGLSSSELAARLSELSDASILCFRGDRTVAFRHALLRDAAVSTLLRKTRRELEMQIATALIDTFPDRADSEPEVVAHHLTEAQAPTRAIEWWRRAGLRAMARSANVEAIAHLEKSLELVGRLGSEKEQRAAELALRTLVGVPLTLTRGWAHPDVGATFMRARGLCDDLGDSAQLIPTRIGLSTFYIVRGQFEAAREFADATLRIAERSGDPGDVLEAALDCGTTAVYLGQYDSALAHLARVKQLYDPARHAIHAQIYGKDPLAVALVHEAMSLCCRGQIDTALRTAQIAAEHTQKLGHAFSHLWALIGLAVTHTLRDEHAQAARVANVIVAEAETQLFPNWLAQGLIYTGLGRTLDGEHGDGIAMIRKGLALWRMTGAELGTPLLSNLLAHALLVAGRAEEARHECEGAAEVAARTGECWTEAHSLRLRGDIEAAIDGDEEAEPWYQRSRERAQEMGARTFELRAAFALAKIRAARDDHSGAREMMRPAIDAMPEGRESRLCREARDFVASLSPGEQ